MQSVCILPPVLGQAYVGTWASSCTRVRPYSRSGRCLCPSRSATILAWVQPTAGCQEGVVGRPHGHSVTWIYFGYEQPCSWYPCPLGSFCSIPGSTTPCPRDLGVTSPAQRRLQIPKIGLSLTEGTTLPVLLPLPSRVFPRLEEQTLMGGVSAGHNEASGGFQPF